MHLRRDVTRKPRLLVIAFAAASLPFTVSGHQQSSSSSGAAPVTLTIRFMDGRTQFRPGETLPLELLFDSSVPKRFVVDGATYDRGGRLTIDDFAVEPNDAVRDPLLDYFALGGGSLGGLRSMGVLGEKPFIVKVSLNDWLRFDKPGRYTLAVRSRRVKEELTGTAAPGPFGPVQSNVLSFEIIARDPEWEAKEFASAMQLLNSAGPGVDRRQGCRTLQFLATDAAVDALIAHFDDDAWACGFEAAAGVISANDRERAVRQLEAGLRMPDRPVSYRYLDTLALLTVLVQHPELRPRQTRETKGRFPQPLDREGLQQLVDSSRTTYTAILDEALPQKTERAKAMILSWRLEQGRTPAATRVREQLVPFFRQLSTDRQATLLEFQWSSVAEPAMVPVLRSIIDDPAAASTSLRDLAVRRLYELAPDEGRTRILAEIVNPSRNATLKTLGALPDRELPQFDDALADNIDPERSGATFEIRTELLQRYASPAVAGQVLPKVDRLIGRLACRPQAALLAYFLRVSSDLGRSLLDRALASRSDTGCFRAVIADIAKLGMTKELEAAAIDRLDDPDPQVVISAAEALGRFGSPAASAPLRARFEEWHRRWASKATEIRFTYAQENSDSIQGTVEHTFVQALTRARAWVADESDVRELQMLCVTDNCRQQIGYIINAARDRYIRVWRADGHDDDGIDVAQYQLTSRNAALEKLSQFPKGTVFRLDVNALAPDVATRVASELMKAAAERGITLTRQ